MLHTKGFDPSKIILVLYPMRSIQSLLMGICLLAVVSCSPEPVTEQSSASINGAPVIGICEGCIQEADTTLVALCDAERRFLINDELRFQDTFSRGFFQAKGVAPGIGRKGSQGVQLTPSEQFGMTYRTLGIFEANDVVRVTVWMQGEGAQITLSVDTKKLFYKAGAKPTGLTDGSWRQVEFITTLPPNMGEAHRVSIYVYHTGAGAVVIDDMRIEKLSRRLYPHRGDAVMELNIPDSSMAHLEAKREAAFERGILFSKKRDWTAATWSEHGESFPVNVRLKGDWLDHLAGRKWSFRIKVKPGEEDSYSFNAQTPAARHYLDEWVMHKMLEQEGVYTTAYDFEYMVVNGQSLGLYAIEEHFDQRFAASRNLPDGPILKFSEDGYWRVVEVTQDEEKLKNRAPVLEAAIIAPFQKSRLDESQFRQQFEEAQHLLHALRYGLQPASELVDVESMAKLVALCDVYQGWHALRWHNMRFYYNPETKLLYPIAYDLYSDAGPLKLPFKPYLGYHDEQHQNVYLLQEYLLQSLFNDEAFRSNYMEYLYKYSTPEWWKESQLAMAEDAGKYYRWMQDEFPSFVLWRTQEQGLEHIRKHIHGTPENAPNPAMRFNYVAWEQVGDTLLSATPIKEQEVLAYRQFVEGEQMTVRVLNFRAEPIRVQLEGEMIAVQQYEPGSGPGMVDVVVPASLKKLPFIVESDADRSFKTKVIQWPSVY